MIKKILFALIITLLTFTNSYSQVTGKASIPPTAILTITKSGAGSGTITSDIPGITRSIINCGATCQIEYLAGSIITLTATASGSSIFSSWSGGGCSGTGACVVTLNSNTTVNAEFWGPPYDANIVGWYKINEGSGAILNNSAPSGNSNRWPNLDVYNTGTFWNYAGFGTGATNQYAYRNTPTVSRSHNATKIAFTRITGAGNAYNRVGGSDYIYQGTSWHFMKHDNYGVGNRVDYVHGNNTDNVVTTTNQLQYNDVVNTWRMQFNLKIGSTQYICIVNPDGTIIYGNTSSANVGYVPTQNHMHFFLFRGWDSANSRWGHFVGNMGDAIFYNDILLSLSDCASWYDQLRSRYGMLARSGW